MLRLADDPLIRSVKVKMSKPGMLGCDAEVLSRRFPAVLEAYDQLIEENYHREWFVSPHEVDRETEARLARVLKPTIAVNSSPTVATPFVG